MTLPPRPHLTVDSPLMGTTNVPIFVLRTQIATPPHGEYSLAIVEQILTYYYAFGTITLVNPLIGVAQMIHETGNLTSQWAARPHRNPAGIGVTGEPGVGVSFGSWYEAVGAHLGRLAAYALPSGYGNPFLRSLIDTALGYRALPDRYRGCAPTIKGLNGTWAVGQSYADRIVEIANSLIDFGGIPY